MQNLQYSVVSVCYCASQFHPEVFFGAIMIGKKKQYINQQNKFRVGETMKRKTETTGRCGIENNRMKLG